MEKVNIVRRFKLLSLFCLELGVMNKQMEELAQKIDEGHPSVVEALNYFEDKLIEVLEK